MWQGIKSLSSPLITWRMGCSLGILSLFSSLLVLVVTMFFFLSNYKYFLHWKKIQSTLPSLCSNPIVSMCSTFCISALCKDDPFATTLAHNAIIFHRDDLLSEQYWWEAIYGVKLFKLQEGKVTEYFRGNISGARDKILIQNLQNIYLFAHTMGDNWRL